MGETKEMNKTKAILGGIIIILSFVGFYLTNEVYSTLNDWNSLSDTNTLHFIGSRLNVVLPAFMGIVSLMFLLTGIAILYQELNTL